VTLSILGDQLGSGAGGGRFTTDLLRALLTDADALAQIEKLTILITEGQSAADLPPLPARARIVRRRFPSRLRQTLVAEWASRFWPAADVAHGPFFYVFPGQGRRSLFTLHDASFLDERFHSTAHNRDRLDLMSRQRDRCSAIVCDSRAVLEQVQHEWPHAAHKCHAIYPGVDGLDAPAERLDTGAIGAPESAAAGAEPFILAVGTIEPRKNYGVLLDACEQLRRELGSTAPRLVVVGKAGWMSDAVCRRLTDAASRGWLRWHHDATDAELARLYQTAAVFTYPSLYEGFGYPPFEAAYANLPMVVSAASSVGEIWSGYARVVEPTDVPAIVEGLKWALGLSGAARQAVVERQKARAAAFTWKRCVAQYLELYQALARQVSQ